MKKMLKTSLLLAALLPASLVGQTLHWQEVSSGTGELLNAVSMYSTNFGVAVGANSTVLQWDGSSWSAMSGVAASGFATNSSLAAVKVINPSLVLIGGSLGNNDADKRGLSVWNGSSWSTKINGGPGGNPVSGFWTDGNGLIVTARTYHTRITRYDGDNNASDIANDSNWTLPYNAGASSPSLQAIHGSSADAIFAVGIGGTVLRSTNEGVAWSSIATSAVNGATQNWSSVFSLSDNQVWMGGNNSQIARWDGTDWVNETVTFRSLAANSVTWRGIYALDENNVWAVGSFGAVKYFDGTAWSDVLLDNVGTSSLNAIDFDGSALWIVGANGKTYTAAIPEPRTAVLVLGGLFALLAGRKFSHK